MPIRRSPNGVRHTRPQPSRDRPEWVVAILRNEWSQSIVIGGRNQPVRPVRIGRTHLGVMGGTLLEASRDAFGMLEQRAIEAISDLEERRVLRL